MSRVVAVTGALVVGQLSENHTSCGLVEYYTCPLLLSATKIFSEYADIAVKKARFKKKKFSDR